MQSNRAINRVFLHYLQITGMIGTFVVFLFDIRNGWQDHVSIVTDLGTFFSLLIGYLISKFTKRDTLAVIIFTSILLVVMVHLFLNSTGYYLGISALVLIVIGYAHSLMLKGKARMIMQLITLFTMTGLMLYQYSYPKRFIDQSNLDLISTAMPFIMIYIIIASTAAILKDRLDQKNSEVILMNHELNEKNREIETQNEELNAQQEELNSINTKLEELVENRTTLLMKKNAQLTDYAFRNAHNVRGPLARILGLLLLHKVDPSLSPEEILSMIEKEAKDMDAIILEIARELGESGAA